jgi:hypothetical protein
MRTRFNATKKENMRIIIDLQACQSGSKYRGIGRYSMSLASAMTDSFSRIGHEVIVALNDSFHEEANHVVAEFGRLSPAIKVVRFSVLSQCTAKKVCEILFSNDI